jgi:hypothetical protein
MLLGSPSRKLLCFSDNIALGVTAVKMANKLNVFPQLQRWKSEVTAAAKDISNFLVLNNK